MTLKIGEYGESVIDFGSGDRVELHPSLDLWIAGARYGNVLPARSMHPYLLLAYPVNTQRG